MDETYSRKMFQPKLDHRGKRGHSRHTSGAPFLVRTDSGHGETKPLQICREPAHIRGQIFGNADISSQICHLLMLVDVYDSRSHFKM
jgi:hypothetical protein